MLSSPEQWHTSINTELEWVPDVSIFLSFFFFFLLCWVFIAGLRLSLAAVRRGYSSLQCVGFSAQWLLLVWSTGTRSQDSVVAAHGLSSCDPRAWLLHGTEGFSQTRDWTCVLCIVRWMPNHWTTREVCQCLLRLAKAWELFGGPVTRTRRVLCWAPGLIPGWETKIPQASWHGWNTCINK